MKKSILNIISFSFLLVSCANPGIIDGGDDDTTPPLILKDNISKLNFNADKFVFDYDEYIDVNDIKKNLFILPGMMEVKAKIVKKTLILEPDSAFHQNTTYSLYCNECVKDVNAGNRMSFNRTFSTGNYLDTGAIYIQLENPEELSNLKIALLEKQTTDSLRNFKSSYILKNVKEGSYSFQGLKSKKYFIWLFTDADQNNLPDWYSPIQFIENVSLDSTYTLKPEKWVKGYKFKSAVSDDNYTKVYYETGNFLADLNRHFPEINKYALYYTPDSALLINTHPYDIDSKEIDYTIPYKNELSSFIKKELRIIQTKKETLAEFILPQAFSAATEIGYMRKAFKLVSIYPDSFPMDSKLFHDTIYIPYKDVKSIKSTDLAYFKLDINNNKQYDVKISSLDGNQVQWIRHINDLEIFMSPGEYFIEIYESEMEHKINPFILKKDAAKIYSKKVLLRAAWEEILNVEIK